MSWLLEQPLPILGMGALLFCMLLGGLLKTGQRWLLGALLAVFFCTTGLLVLERLVITPKEQIEQTLRQIASDLESNQIPLIVRHISASASELRGEAGVALKRIEIHKVTVKSNLETEFTENAQRAVARFNATVDASQRVGVIRNQHGVWYFVVHFNKEDGHWRVVRYQRHDPLNQDSGPAAR